MELQCGLCTEVWFLLSDGLWEVVAKQVFYPNTHVSISVYIFPFSLLTIALFTLWISIAQPRLLNTHKHEH